MKNIILVVDHDPQTFRILDIVLGGQDFDVVECPTGRQAVRLCASIKPDIVLLDIEMPDMEGGEIIATLREWTQVPIILLSSHMTNDDVVSGLNMGADDYVIKPFNVDVLMARINASLRKSAVHETGEPELCNGPLRMDLVRHKVYLNNHPVKLTPKEYRLLRYFIIHRGEMLSHRDLLCDVWGASHADDTQYLRVFVMQIREKIETVPTKPAIIKTEPGIGYRMEILQEHASSEQGELMV